MTDIDRECILIDNGDVYVFVPRSYRSMNYPIHQQQFNP